jgi:tRNA (mo5U34)-methyltransferase
VIDGAAVAAGLRDAGLQSWADVVASQLVEWAAARRHGDWPRWQQAIESLPAIGTGRVDIIDGALTIQALDGPDDDLDRQVRDALQALRPWRKGPYRVAGVTIDTEWRSDWKWERLVEHVEDLRGRLILDVGCGNGYHCWRMAHAGARRVVGIDPAAVFLAQFLAIRRLLAPVDPHLAARVDVLPLGIEDLPRDLGRFDTVFSMGVLYHRRSPIDHLYELRGALRTGGQLVLETLVIEGHAGQILVPTERYAKMRNVWFIPSVDELTLWLQRVGFRDVRTVDVTATTTEEQRSTDWMRFESLADFLDPADSSRTVEGYPAPIRAIVVARA